MNLTKTVILSLCSLFIISCSSSRYVKVACVGDSITEGMTIKWQSNDGYPAQLDNLLGKGYEVLNLGRSSTTMMRNGDFPYWSAKEFSDVLRYHPNIIVLMLGTNDSKLKQWNPESFRESYQAMVDTFLTIKPKPSIYLCLPVPPQQTRWEITDSVIINGVIPIVSDIAKKNNLKVIDMYNAIGHDAALFSRDGIHPNETGARKMAVVIGDAIRSK